MLNKYVHGQVFAALLVITNTDYHKNETFPMVKCIRRYVQWTFDHFGWSSFDVNRSILDEDKRQKQIFTFSFPVTFSFRPQICPLVILVQSYVSTELEVSIAFLFHSKIKNWQRIL